MESLKKRLRPPRFLEFFQSVGAGDLPDIKTCRRLWQLDISSSETADSGDLLGVLVAMPSDRFTRKYMKILHEVFAADPFDPQKLVTS